MARTRTNMPASYLIRPETVAETYRAVHLRLLKLYTIQRKPHWDSYAGKAENMLKSGASMVRGLFANNDDGATADGKVITTINDSIMKELNSIDSYVRCIKLIRKLNDTAETAQNTSNMSSLRTGVYFALIMSIQEFMKRQFPNEYAQDLQRSRQALAQANQLYKSEFRKGLSVKESLAEYDKQLISLVLLGDRDIYDEAFMPGKNLFPYLTHMSQEDISNFNKKLIEQFTLEEKKTAKLSEDELLNPNIPFQLQRFFTRVLLMKEFKIDSMISFVDSAMQDHGMVNGQISLSAKFFPPAATPSAQPSDMEDLMRQESPQQKSPNLIFENDNNAPASAPASAPQTPQPVQNLVDAELADDEDEQIIFEGSPKM